MLYMKNCRTKHMYQGHGWVMSSYRILWNFFTYQRLWYLLLAWQPSWFPPPKRITLPCTIYSQYIAVIYDMIYDKTSVRFALTNDTLTGELWGGCLLWVIYQKNERDISRTHWVANSKGVRIVLDNMSSAIIVFICKTKAVQYSHELTWRYWHIHVARK